jgi:hypothetical protein
MFLLSLILKHHKEYYQLKWGSHKKIEHLQNIQEGALETSALNA